MLPTFARPTILVRCVSAMLIASERHTAKDLAIWRANEQVDFLHAKRLQKKIERSLAAVESFCEQGCGYVSVSWGKDSVACLDIVLTICPEITAVHLRPSNHNPDCDAVRDNYLASNQVDYHEVRVDYSTLHASELPEHLLDIETDKVWFAAWRKVARTFGARYHSGIRARESAQRAMRCKANGHSTANTNAPLAWWTQQDVFAYMASRSLPVHPAYAMVGGGRWDRRNLRVAEIGDTHGTGFGRTDWEREYYSDSLNRLLSGKAISE